MQGGLFGLNITQKSYLYICQLIPTLIVIFFPDLLKILLLTLLFYIISITTYIHLISIEKSYYPYYSHELSKLNKQVKKGGELAISGFLLITVYGILVLRIGRVVLPGSIDIGSDSRHYWWICFILTLINPFLEEIYWRLFLPKTFQSTYQRLYGINVCYLLYHFSLFCCFLGFWRAVPFVATFYSVGNSMSYIKQKYGIVAAILTHYGITFAGFALLTYLRVFTYVKV